MSVTVIVWCRRCGVEAPEIGDLGFVGTPRLTGRKQDGLLPFGVLYEGFAALGMVTAELAAFKAFLDAHAGHPIDRSSDDGEEGSGGDEPEARAPSRLEAFRFAGGAFVQGFHELACPRCEKTFRASSAERLKPFEDFAPNAAAIARFQRDVVEADGDNFYRVIGFPFEDVARIGKFLKAHAGHGVRARIDRAEHAGPASSRAGTTTAAEPWTPPTWAPEAHERFLGPVSASTPPLLAGLLHFDAARRADACAALAATGECFALGYLVPLLEDPASAVRVAAARAIGALGDPRGVRALGRALLDESAEVREAARAALARLGSSEDESLRQARSLRGPYDVPLGGYKRMAATPEALAAAVRDPRRSVRHAAVQSLATKQREPWARELAFVVAIDPHGDFRHRTAEWLRKSDDPRAVPTLLALLADHHERSATAAASELGRRPIPEVEAALHEAIGRGEARIAEAAADTLGKLKAPRAGSRR